ncbi:MAG: hypothetical protein KDD50_14515 [Bdellovibrionales bacterium]|nr:hypothetical protein [Bdellovibrionales bacterium]
MKYLKSLSFFLTFIFISLSAYANQEDLLFKSYSPEQLISQRPSLYQNIPFSLLFPVNRWAQININAPTTNLVKDIGGSPSIEDDAGLRILTIDGKKSNYHQVAVQLASRGILQTGDVLVKSNVRSASAGMYYQLQGGATHSAIIIVKEVGNEKRVFNIDMPAYEAGNLSSEWYRTSATAPYEHYHIFRPIHITLEKKKNLEDWAWQYYTHREKIYGGSPKTLTIIDNQGRVLLKNFSFRGNYTFNSDYSKSSFDDSNQDVTLMALKAAGKINGYFTRPHSDYCSGFVYNMQLLKGCRFDSIPSSPSTPKDRVLRALNLCIDKEGVFYPMNVFSNPSNPGLVDGPLLAMQALKLPLDKKKQVLQQLVDSIFETNLDTNFRSSHQSAAIAFDALKPYIKHYYQLMLDKKIMDGQQIQNQIMAQSTAEIKAFLSALNYPPSAFIINSLLPNDHPEKKFKYILTLDFDREE